MSDIVGGAAGGAFRTLRRVRPRPAASLILVDRDGSAPRLLMGRRHREASFMPGLWVFPGGRCDRADAGSPTATDFTPDTLTRLRDACSEGARDRLPHALGVAAVRETFEETGLRLGQTRPDTEAGGGRGGVLPDLAALRFVGRAITPTVSPRRFDARFFEADAGALDQRIPTPSTELDEVAWLTFEAALEAELPTVTRLLVIATARRVADASRAPLFLSARRGAAWAAADLRAD